MATSQNTLLLMASPESSIGMRACLALSVEWNAYGLLKRTFTQSSFGILRLIVVRRRAAKEKKLYLYAPSASGTAAPSGTRPNGAAAYGDKRSFEGHVTRIWGGDQISVLDKETNKERRVQLSSTRAPKSVTKVSMK